MQQKGARYVRVRALWLAAALAAAFWARDLIWQAVVQLFFGMLVALAALPGDETVGKTLLARGIRHAVHNQFERAADCLAAVACAGIDYTGQTTDSDAAGHV